MYEVYIVDNYYSEELEQWFTHKSKIGEFKSRASAKAFIGSRRSYLEYGDNPLYNITYKAL